MKQHIKIRHISALFAAVFFIVALYHYSGLLIHRYFLDKFQIKTIEVNHETTHAALAPKLLGKNLIYTSFTKIKRSINEVLDNKYSNITLRKILPSTLKIDIEVNKPIAYVENSNNQQLFFDYLGNQTYKLHHNHEDFTLSRLIKLEGEGAQQNFLELFKIIDQIDNIECNKMKFIDERRWNIYIQNDVIIKLSERNFENTALFLQKLINTGKLINEVDTIDLRFYPQKIFITEGRNAKN